MTVRQPADAGLLFLIALAASFLLYGCSSSQKIYLSENGSGKAEISIRMSPMVLRYAEDVAGGFSGSSGSSSFRLFDTDSIRSRMLSLSEIHDVDVAYAESQDKLKLSFSFDSIEDIFPDDASSEPVFTFKEKNGVKTLTVLLTPGNFHSVTGFLGLNGNEVMETFGPQKDDPFTEDEYKEMLEYLFEEYASKKAIDSAADNSVIDIGLSVDGTFQTVDSESFVSVSYNGSSGRIRIPLLAVLTLSEPIRIKAVWR